jgi:hypothetical protein
MANAIVAATRGRADSIALSRPRIGLSPTILIVPYALRVGVRRAACFSPLRHEPPTR